MGFLFIYLFFFSSALLYSRELIEMVILFSFYLSDKILVLILTLNYLFVFISLIFGIQVGIFISY